MHIKNTPIARCLEKCYNLFAGKMYRLREVCIENRPLTGVRSGRIALVLVALGRFILIGIPEQKHLFISLSISALSFSNRSSEFPSWPFGGICILLRLFHIRLITPHSI